MEDKKEIKKIYYLLKGMYDSLDIKGQEYVSIKCCEQFNELLEDLNNIIKDASVYRFKVNIYDDSTYLPSFILKNNLNPVISYLKNTYIENGEYQIAKVGYLYNSIENSEIKERCGDILLGENAFDRAINQATQILENRIKIKAGLENKPLIGIPLVSKAIHSKISETILQFSDKTDIQEGYSNLFKGIISIYRNPTHHSLSFECSRDYALKVCAHIDELLKILECSKKVK